MVKHGISIHFGREIEELEIIKHMKRYGSLFNKITDIDNLVLAHTNAKKGKRHYKEVQQVDTNVRMYCHNIRRMLEDGTYKIADYKVFKKEDKGKIRKLYKLPYYPDRIIQHAIMQILEPIWKKTLITDTYQAIKGRGVHKCINKVRKVIQKGDVQYCLQIDINKFYPSIKNHVLKDAVRRKIKCKQTLSLLDGIIDSCEEVPIGNYISQYFGNILLSDIDHKIKEKYGVKHYFRYCDDIVILSNNKDDLHYYLKELNTFLQDLELTIKKNHQVYKITPKRGVDFLGVVISKDSIRIRKRIVKAFKTLALSEDTRSAKALMSCFGWIKITQSYNLWDKYINIYINSLTNKYGNKIYDLPDISNLRGKICNIEQ